MGPSHTMKLLALVNLITAVAAIHDSFIDVESFKGFSVLRLTPSGKEQISYVSSLQDKPYYDFWTEPTRGVGHTVDVMAPPAFLPQLQQDLQARGIKFEVMITDLDALIQLEKIPAKSSSGGEPILGHSMTWDKYHSLEDMYSYLDYLEETYDYVSTESIGKTFEGRDMRVASVCKGGCGSKPAVWIDGGIHAREWISPATVIWILKELVENNGNHADLLDNLDWYILPCHNPDGYAFSREHNRMWRKTRSDTNSLFGCKGVDANRNYGFHWNEGGSSNDKCSDMYHGPKGWSEVENRNVRDFITSKKDRLIFYNSLHSYSQMILLPWGYTAELYEDYEHMLGLAMVGSEALTAVHGKKYKAGCIPCILYPASGGSLDWALGEAGIKFSIGMELRDKGEHGFLLPPEQIVPTGEEVWAFTVAVLEEILKEQK